MENEELSEEMFVRFYEAVSDMHRARKADDKLMYREAARRALAQLRSLVELEDGGDRITSITGIMKQGDRSMWEERLTKRK